MIARIIEASARNKWLVLALTAIAIALGILSVRTIPLDAIPDLSDTQVIIYSRWDRSPDIIEDQVTYPIVTALLGAPRVKTIRGLSDFGFSYVYVIFEDGTDLYWARSRVLEYLSKIQARLPEGVKTEIGPDATGVGWVYQYALVDDSQNSSTQQLRSVQDWFLRYSLQSVPGVAEVASVGGFAKEYQVSIDPNRLAAYQLSLGEIADAIRRSNSEVGGRLLEVSGREFMLRGRGYVKSIDDIGSVVVRTNDNGTPVYVRDVGSVALGPALRRGVTDLDGKGDAVGAIVIMRQGENALTVIRAVKARLAELAVSLPPGVRIVPTYDRSDLIDRAIDTLRSKLIEEMIIVSIVILIFLWHVPSAIIPIVTIPVSVLLAFIPMSAANITANIMSLAGIAISVGVLVDGAIVEVENAYKRLQLWEAGGRQGDYHAIRLEALKEVGPSVFFSLLVIAVAFLPVFTLVDQEGRMFKPLAYTKTLTMAIAALLAITLDPALRMLFTRMDRFSFRPRPIAWLTNLLVVGTYYPEEKHPISRLIHRVYEPVCRFVLRWPRLVIALSVTIVAVSVPMYFRLGSEFMPPLNEGSILYMPTTLPGISIDGAARLLETQDQLLRKFPEVQSVFGKAGRAETSTDPAPLSMMETTVLLKPEAEWPRLSRWYSSWAPDWLARVLRPVWPEHASHDDLVEAMNQLMQIPGTTNAFTMPIKNRTDMLSTGIRTPVGLKVYGPDVTGIERIGLELERVLRLVPGTRSVFAERAAGGYFLDFDLKRDALARYGLTIGDANDVIGSALGAAQVTTTVEGRARYDVTVRYPRELREDLGQLARVLVPLRRGGHVPLGELAELRMRHGPAMIRDENGLLAAYVFVDLDPWRDVGGYVADAKRAVAAQLTPPTGYTIAWSGQYENMERVHARLWLVVPITVMLIFLLLYANTKSAFKALIVLLAVPFSAVGAIWLLWLLGYNISVAVWVGMIALMGLDAETGVFMLLFLDIAHDEAEREGRMRTHGDLVEAIIHGAVKRVRPKAMTVCAAFVGLLPILWSMGAGADMMKRVAAPMVGGLVTSFALELIVYPAIYFLWKRRNLVLLPRPRSLLA